MTAVTAKALQGLVANALERMAFVFTDPCDVSARDMLTRSAANAVIELSGPKRRTISVSATAGMVQEVASGMIGCEPYEIDADDHGQAAVGELANVFGGELVQLLSTTGELLSIGLPRDAEDSEIGSLVDGGSLVGVVSSDLGELMITVSN